MRTLKGLALAVLLAAPARAAFEDPFWSARAAALGGAVTAMSADATSAFYNPASTVFLDKVAIQFTYAKLFTGLDNVDLSLGDVAFVQPLRSFNSLTVGYGSVNASSLRREETITLGFSHLLREVSGVGDLSWGVSGRYLAQSFTLDERTAGDAVFKDGSTRADFALDLHAYIPELEVLTKNLSLGVSARAINRPDVGFKEQDKLPVEIALGLAYHWKRWAFPVEFVKRGSDFTPSFGFEGRFAEERLSLRAGTDTHQAGAGLGYRTALSDRLSLSFDYTFLWPLEIQDTSGSHRATIGISF